MTANSVQDASWLLDDLVRRASGVQRAALLSADGLLIGRSAALSRADADLGLVAFEVNRMVRRVGSHLSATPRKTEPADNAS